MEKVCKKDYIPTFADILKIRIKTTGVNEKVFDIENFNGKGYRLHLFDCAGQRSERRKWIDKFVQATAIIYVVSLSGFDQVCYEDNVTPRMEESLKLWQNILDSRYFKNIPFFLVFNKKDEFIEKLKHKNIDVYFKGYTGKNDFDECYKFIQKQFIDLNTEESRVIHCFDMCATETEYIEKTFNEIKKIVLK